MLLLVRPAVGSGLAAVPGVSTASAAGTEVSAALPAAAPDLIGTALTVGAGGSDEGLLQAPSDTAVRPRAATLQHLRRKVWG